MKIISEMDKYKKTVCSSLRETCPYSELLLRISPYSFQMRENTDQNSSV